MMFVSKFCNCNMFKFKTIPQTIFKPSTTSWVNPLTNKFWFHTTPKVNINPVFLIFLKPASKLASMVTGRYFRVWWRRLTPEQKHYYKVKYLKNSKVWTIFISSLTLGGGVYYFTHIQTTPITNRKRFIGISDDQMAKLSEFEFVNQIEQIKDKVIPPNHPFYQKVELIVQRIVNSNQDLEKMKTQKWTLYIVNDEQSNAFVLPTGQIFVYTGLMKYVTNDNELAFMLAHEMAHTVLNHGAEQVSFSSILDMFVIVSMAMIWAIMPGDGVAMVTQWFYDKALNIMLHLPYSRKLELEADEVGLKFIAKACYDVRDSSSLWLKWSLLQQLNGGSEGGAEVELPSFLSTHPNFEERSKRLDGLMDEAVQLRIHCDCPKLPTNTNNGRDDVERLQKLLVEKEQNKRKI